MADVTSCWSLSKAKFPKYVKDLKNNIKLPCTHKPVDCKLKKKWENIFKAFVPREEGNDMVVGEHKDVGEAWHAAAFGCSRSQRSEEVRKPIKWRLNTGVKMSVSVYRAAN